MFPDLNVNFQIPDTDKAFYGTFRKVSNPEINEKVISEKSMRIFEQNAEEFNAEYCYITYKSPATIEWKVTEGKT